MSRQAGDSRSRYRPDYRFPFFFISVSVFLAIADLHAAGRSSIDAELQNLRSLPLGYRAWCENGDLLFKSPVSARFRVGKAALCAGKPNGYVVCTSDAAGARPEGRKNIPLCSEIEASGA